MQKNENIVLDAEVRCVVDKRAFRAGLGNGHEFIAYFPPSETSVEEVERCVPGARIRARFSPYDFSRGEIVDVVKEQDE